MTFLFSWRIVFFIKLKLENGTNHMKPTCFKLEERFKRCSFSFFLSSYTSLTLKSVNTEGRSPFRTKMEEKKWKDSCYFKLVNLRKSHYKLLNLFCKWTEVTLLTSFRWNSNLYLIITGWEGQLCFQSKTAESTMTAKISSDHFTQKRHVELLSHHPQSYRPPRYTHTKNTQITL